MSKLARLKKPLLIIGFLILVFLIAYLLWITFFQGGSSLIAPGETPETQTPGGLPSIDVGSEPGDVSDGGDGRLPGIDGSDQPDQDTEILPQSPDSLQPNEVAVGGYTQTTVVVPDKTLGPSLNSDGSLNFYNRDDNLFYKLDKNGNLSQLSDRAFYQVDKVTWANNSDKAIIEFPDNNKILYDFDTKKQVTLPSYWEDFSFSPSGENITAKSIGLDVDNRWLIVAKDDSADVIPLEPIGSQADYVYPSWSPNNQIVAYYTQGLDFDRREIYFVGLNGENFKSTIAEGRGIQAQWSKNGDNLLYSAYHSRDGYRPRLWVVNSTPNTIGQSRQNLELNTWADKCTFASNTEVYCAVPEQMPEGAGLIPEITNDIKDNLYKVDLRTGAKTLIAIPDGHFNISNIIVPSDQSVLYFTDKFNQMIYQVKLK